MKFKVSTTDMTDSTDSRAFDSLRDFGQDVRRMKTSALILAALILGLVPAMAQEDATIENTPTSVQAARAAQRKLDAERRAREALEGKPLVYGGLLRELRKAENKKKLLSLRQPVDPKNDYKNIYLDERTARPKGFVLFSIGF